MMGGIAPLYDEGPVLSMESRDGARMRVDVLDGRLHRRGEVFPVADGLPALIAAPQAIAVILGPRTASSGEILALGFRRQANVRFFGASTAGATTSNWSVRTPNGGLLAITASRLLDRSDVVQAGPLIPDEPSETPLSAAAAWLDTQCP
jgi:carboxyl-terminal processing protease